MCDPPDEQQCETSEEVGRDCRGDHARAASGSVLGDWVVVDKRWKKKSKQIEEEIEVLEMRSDAMVMEVAEKFIGAVGIQEESLLNMNFQVAGVKKALAAVSRICKAGNVVQFGENPDECYIQSKTNKKKVMMQQRRGSYVIKVKFVKSVVGNDGVRSLKKVGSEFITVDSGAEESVCPLGWGDTFELTAVKPGKEMKMVNAGGGEMPHYGSRKVQFAASTF